MQQGVQQDVTALQYILIQLREKFASLWQEEQEKALSDYEHFHRQPHEAIDECLARWELLRARARNKSGLDRGYVSDSQKLLNALQISKSGVTSLLAKYDGAWPTTEEQYENLKIRVRRAGHTIEGPNDRRQAYVTNPDSPHPDSPIPEPQFGPTYPTTLTPTTYATHTPTYGQSVMPISGDLQCSGCHTVYSYQTSAADGYEDDYGSDTHDEMHFVQFRPDDYPRDSNGNVTRRSFITKPMLPRLNGDLTLAAWRGDIAPKARARARACNLGATRVVGKAVASIASAAGALQRTRVMNHFVRVVASRSGIPSKHS